MLIKLFGASLVSALTLQLGNAAVINPVYGPAFLDDEDELAQVDKDSYLMVPDQYFNLAQVQAPFSTDLAEVDS